MLFINFIVKNYLQILTIIVIISAIGFFWFAKFRRQHDRTGVVQYTLAGFIFGMSVGSAVITLPEGILYYTPLMVYQIGIELGVISALFAIAVAIIAGTETRRDMQDLLKRLDDHSEE